MTLLKRWPQQSSLLGLGEGKILPRTLREAYRLPELAMWKGTIPDRKLTLLFHV